MLNEIDAENSYHGLLLSELFNAKRKIDGNSVLRRKIDEENTSNFLSVRLIIALFLEHCILAIPVAFENRCQLTPQCRHVVVSLMNGVLRNESNSRGVNEIIS